MVDIKAKLHRDQRRIVVTTPDGKTYAARTPNELWSLMWSCVTDPSLEEASTSLAVPAAPRRAPREVVEAELVEPEQGLQRRGPVQTIRVAPPSHQGHQGQPHQTIHEPGRDPGDVVADALVDAGLAAGQKMVRGIQRLSFRGKVRKKGRKQELDRIIREKRHARVRGEG